MTPKASKNAIDVLVAHQRKDISSCICGWSRLGESFCEHQVDMLIEAGYTQLADPTPNLWKVVMCEEEVSSHDIFNPNTFDKYQIRCTREKHPADEPHQDDVTGATWMTE